MYHTIAELLGSAESRGAPLWRIVLDNERELTGLPESEILIQLKGRLDVMRRASKNALAEGLPMAGGLISGAASRQHRYALEHDGLLGSRANRMMAFALSCSETNAAMGKICAAPTAGACGVLPAVLFSVQDDNGLPDEAVLKGLLTASGIGTVVMRNATVSGAEGGCQAECGTAAGMAAAAAVEMAGGTCEAAVHACSFALISAMGLVCDPVAGLVQVPCALRNATQAISALACADMALGGSRCVIPADEVLDAVFRVGKLLPWQLKETAQGGLADTPTGKGIASRIFNIGRKQ